MITAAGDFLSAEPNPRLERRIDRIIDEVYRNEDKYEKRAKRKGHIFDTADSDFDTLHTEVAYEPDYIEKLYLKDMKKALWDAIGELTDILMFLPHLLYHCESEKASTAR